MTRFPTYAELRSRAKAFRERSATNRFIIVCALVFAAQALGLFFAEAFALNPFWVRSGCLLNFLSYGFLHGGFWHLALNMLALYFAGNAVERYDSGGNATAVFLGGIAVGGLAWLGVVEAVAAAPAPGAMSPHTLVGASAGVAALFSYFSVAHRDSELRAMLFSVTLRPGCIISSFYQKYMGSYNNYMAMKSQREAEAELDRQAEEEAIRLLEGRGYKVTK